MRLLQYNSAGQLSLTEDLYGDDIPEYAILSHTWGADTDEVVFRDLVEGTGMSKAGYEKIRFCEEQARRDNIQYFWVDTCCIDKSSSAELQVAIVLMFSWYRDAAKCYVYLSDVQTGWHSQSSELSWESAFRQSRWFTRSWTLQELLAPSSVEFFSREGRRLGDKKSLERHILEITGIPVDALRGKPLSQFTAAERMSWAERRLTKREEDRAYSLFGIFNVFMPILYGEGGRNAFGRLQKEIDQQSDHLNFVDHQTTNVERPTEPDFEIGQFLPSSNDARESQAVDYITDSGYGGSGASKAQSYSKLFRGSSSAALVATIPESEAESASHETHTVYSDTESLREPKLLEYAAAFADELYGSLPPGFDKAEFERVLPIFDELLQAFAFKVSFDGTTPEHRNLMYLVHRYRSQIAENLRQRYDDDSGMREVLNLTGYDDMNVEDKMALLWKNEDADSRGVPEDRPDNIPDNDIDMDVTQLPDLHAYREIIKRSSSYQWLLWRIAAADKLECPGPVNAQKAIRDYILKNVALQKQFSRGKYPQVNIKYYLYWDLSAFHAEQRYLCSVEQVLEQAITITGYGNDVQAATCLQYINQTWGGMGVRLLHILQQAVLGSPNATSSHNSSRSEQKLSAELSISASYRHGKFMVFASGIPYSVAEVGELLAWLGASLRSSPSNKGAVSYKPVASFVPQSRLQAHEISTDQAGVSGLCAIRFQFQTVGKSDSDSPFGSCWLDSFRNPVVVEGYPIPRRSRAGSGLEATIEIIASLVNAKYLVNFCRRTFLKGFSTMLAVTEVIGSTVFWHLFYNEDGAYISYEDARVPRIQENDASQTLDQTTLATSRHILGWCKKVSCLAGTRNANYNIGWSKLHRPHSAFAFDKISITAGKYVNIGTSMSIGIKDKPEHVSYDDDYLSTLEMISERHFVFYDIIDRRAWLLDGASALLHLLRAFIKYSQTKSRLKDFFIFKDDELEEADGSRKGGEAAFYVLANEYNQLLPFWRKTATPTEEITMKHGSAAKEVIKCQKAYFCLKDRVLQICHILQQILAHQDDVHTRDGVGARVKLTPRRQLEGFDFMDVATNQGVLWPKVNCIHAWGEGWVDLTRKLHCVALFGTGFGQLMKPIGKSCRLCMANIPQGPELLGITTTDLLGIIERKGENNQTPWRIVEDMHWYVPDQLFESCRCDSPARRDRVQVFLPATHPKLWGMGLRSPQLVTGGAILVGHSFKYPLRWGNRRDPEEGEPETSVDTSPAPPHDSGIDSSNASERVEDWRSARQPHWARSPRGRLYPYEGSSSDSSMFLHTNRQFVYYESSSQRGSDSNAETSILLSSSSTGSRATDRMTREERERVEPTSETEVDQSRRSDDVERGRSRPTGSFCELWTSMGKRKLNEI